MSSAVDKIAANAGKILASPAGQKAIQKTGDAIAKLAGGLLKALLR
ncbi:MAG: hypothetical protein II877_11530 [Synergistaceae bacterium]|nr:hypothetical protein [Synergistaceae bacterium]MBQ6971679.1 hypothetical protein [Synergistaceae bacterium]